MTPTSDAARDFARICPLVENKDGSWFKNLSAVAAPIALPGSTTTTILIERREWTGPAAWTFVCGGAVVPHQLDTLVKNPDGSFTGSGHFPDADGYRWDLSGNVSGSTVTWTITYTGLQAGFVYSGSGTIAADGSLQSDVSSNANQCTQVTTGPGVFP
jgi:hypothetical protein